MKHAPRPGRGAPRDRRPAPPPRPQPRAAAPPAAPALGWALPVAWAAIALYALAALALILGPHRVGDVFTETDFYGAYGPHALQIEHGHLNPADYAVVGPGFELALALAG